MGDTIVEYFSAGGGHRCGYCGSKNGNYTHGMWAHTMTCQDYEDLICRGWRRSGKYCYKPTMNRTCCPLYTIRCLVQDFKLNKSHKKILKDANKYFNQGQVSPTQQTVHEVANKRQESENATQSDLRKKMMGTVSNDSQHDSSAQKMDTKPELKKGAGPDPDKPPCRKAKEMRKEKALKKNPDKKYNIPTPKSLHDFVNELKPGGAHDLQIKLVRSHPRTDEFNETFRDEYNVYKKYQMKIHNDKPHEVTEKQFTRFLIDSPLIPDHNNDGIESGYGSFHQQYWIDGKLWMVGVIDILPTAVSSVYLFYDPDFAFLSPGTYSALREIEFVQTLHAIQPNIISYMMGYYVHSCPKMRYKGQYHPSYLLCPEATTWNPIEECIPKLEENKYARFAPPGIEDPEFDIYTDKVLVLHQHTAMPYVAYKIMKSGENQDENEVIEYAKLVGKTCSQRMLLFRS